MVNIILSRSKKTGLPPGTPIYVGDEEPLPAHIDEITYDESDFREKIVDDVSEIIEDLRAIPEVLDAQFISGVYDLIVKIKADDMQSLKTIMTRKLRKNSLIRSTLNLVVI